MTPGPKPLASIRRIRAIIGADCMDCGWRDDGSLRNRAIEHARDEGHKVHLVLEETTVYKGQKQS